MIAHRSEQLINRDLSSSAIVSPFDLGGESSRAASRTIGDILVGSGRLLPDDAARVLRYQKEHPVHFGEAAIRLGVATAADVEFALSQQFEYPYLVRGESPVHPSLIAAYDPFSPEVEALRTVRTQLLIRLIHTDRTRSRLAVLSSEPGDGRSYLAANLAVVFSQLGERVLLVDGDLRNPHQHELFGVSNRIGLSSLLAGRCGMEAIQRIPSLINLSVLPAGSSPPNPQELLSRPVFTQCLDRLSSDFSIVILDTPPGKAHAESLTIASRAGAAIMIARKNHSHLNQVQDMAQSLSHARVALIGAVFNDF